MIKFIKELVFIFFCFLIVAYLFFVIMDIVAGGKGIGEDELQFFVYLTPVVFLAIIVTVFAKIVKKL